MSMNVSSLFFACVLKAGAKVQTSFLTGKYFLKFFFENSFILISLSFLTNFSMNFPCFAGCKCKNRDVVLCRVDRHGGSLDHETEIGERARHLGRVGTHDRPPRPHSAAAHARDGARARVRRDRVSGRPAISARTVQRSRPTASSSSEDSRRCTSPTRTPFARTSRCGSTRSSTRSPRPAGAGRSCSRTLRRPSGSPRPGSRASRCGRPSPRMRSRAHSNAQTKPSSGARREAWTSSSTTMRRPMSRRPTRSSVSLPAPTSASASTQGTRSWAAPTHSRSCACADHASGTCT